MSVNLKICEHESVEWIIKKLPKFSNNIFVRKVKVRVTSFDVNAELFIIGTNTGHLYYISRRSNNVQTLLLKKNQTVCQTKVIQTIDISIAAGFEDGSVFVIKIPTKSDATFSDANQFILPVDHTSAITHMTWSKNSDKLFTGDSSGNVFCTEVNSINKTVSSYCICNGSSQINYLSYNYQRLVISTGAENVIYNIMTHNRSAIGTKSRKPGNFGACFVDKICRPEEVEIVVVRPDSKVRISDLDGVIKRSISLKCETLFSAEKSISLLPSVTSQSNTDYINKLQTGVIKHQLGFVSPMNENEVLFWSTNGLIIFDISTDKIVSSTCNLGAILSVSVCRFNNVIETDSPFSALPESRNIYQNLLEIWILRKPIRDDESTLIRLSTLPLATSKLTIDPFNCFAECPDSKFSSKPTISTVDQISSDLFNTNGANNNPCDEVATTAKSHDTWIPNFEIKVPEKLHDIRNNVLELTKKTKEIFKQSHDLFENTNEGVEQAIELTEEGLLIKFDKISDDESIISSKYDVTSDTGLEIETIKPVYNDIANKSSRKNIRQIQLVNIDDDPFADGALKPPYIATDHTAELRCAVELIDDVSKSASISNDHTIELKSFEDKIKRSSQIPFMEDEYLSKTDEIFNTKETEESINMDHERYYSTIENTLSISCDDPASPLLYSGQFSDRYYNISESEGKSFEIVKEAELSNTSEKCADINSIEKSPDNDKCLSNNIGADFISDYLHPIENIDDSTEITNIEETSAVSQTPFMDSYESLKTSIIKEEKPILTDNILYNSNKWISHRGPTLSGSNKISSISINRRMIWLTDSKGSLHVGFQNTGERLSYQGRNTSDHMQWFQDNKLLTDKIHTSPEGVILFRDKSGEILVYTGITKIWTPRVVKEKVLLKSNWEIMMTGINNIDIDNDILVVVTRKGELKVMNEIADRSHYKQTLTASTTGHVTLATTFNGIIWCVTEIVDPDSKLASQHLFACSAKDDEGKINVSYWRTVPVPKELITETEEHLGILGGSLAIKCIQLGQCGLAWIVTFQNQCFFSQNISEENPTGDGFWYQISLNFLYQILTHSDENVAFGLDIFSYGIQSTVDKIFGHNEAKSRTNSSVIVPSVLISTKGAPKRSYGNGLIWVTCMEKNSPCILFESQKNILGHRWIDCFTNAIQKKTISLPSTLTWSSVTYGFENVLWLVSNSNEIFCYWKETRIRNITVPASFGKVIQIASHDSTIAILTVKPAILIRCGISSRNPIGTDWKEVHNTWNVNKETVKHISCVDNELWLVTAENIFYNEDLRSLLCNNYKHCKWKSINLKLNDSFTATISHFQVTSKPPKKRFIWFCSEPDGQVYLGSWSKSILSFTWTYIPGPRAKSVHISDENIWIIELSSGEIFVRCGINWDSKATGDYWTHIPMSTSPVVSLSVSRTNDVVVIDNKLRLLEHFWSVVESNKTQQSFVDTLSLDDMNRYKSIDGDWELLND